MLLAKLEYLNSGGSNRPTGSMAMIEAAEREESCGPEARSSSPFSGNTGVGLAIAAAARGYRCIFVMPDKMSQEKISMLRLRRRGAVITPTAVEHDSPESYYSVSDRLGRRSQAASSRTSTRTCTTRRPTTRRPGLEIWEQTGEEIDALVISVGTGGTISGVGRYPASATRTS